MSALQNFDAPLLLLELDFHWRYIGLRVCAKMNTENALKSRIMVLKESVSRLGRCFEARIIASETA